jgi:two-component system response regulator HydG
VPDSRHSFPPSSRLRALVIEGDESACERVSQLLTLAGHTVRIEGSADAGARALTAESFDVMLVDAALASGPGLAQLVAAGARSSVSTIVGTHDRADRGAALGVGAYATIVRPYDPDELRAQLERAGRDAQRSRELSTLRGLLGGQCDAVIVGRSPATQRVRELVQRAAASRSAVLVSGEAGTGKELVARTIHALSDRAREACTLVECTGRDPGALEQELFGGPADGTRGALGRRTGGTVIVDDATALPAALQSRLLRTLQEGALADGAHPRVLITVREERAPGFGAPPTRYDALGRAGVFAIAVPPLRDRRSDIPMLAAHFRARFARETGAEAPALAPDSLGALLGHDWPGNVRQLEHYVGRLMLLPAGSRIPFDAATPSLAAQAAPASLVSAARAAHWTLEDLEREYIQRVLEEEGGHQSRAAELLGIDRRTLYRKLKQYRAQEAARRRTEPAAGAATGRERSA